MPFRTPSSFVPPDGPVAPAGPRWVFAVHAGQLLVTGEREPVWLEETAALGVPVATELYLGMVDGSACVMALVEELEPAALDAGWALVGLRELLGVMSPSWVSMAGRAVQLAEWERTHRFCGVCGVRTQNAPRDRAKRCPACGHVAFPRLSPAIIVAVERGDELLLARGPHFPPGVHSCLAGFVEPGESAEEAVHREVFEEVGIRVRDVRYFSSQPWPFPHSLMLGFFATYESGEIEIDGEEIVSAAFYRGDAMPAMFPGRVSISQWLIADFLARRGR